MTQEFGVRALHWKRCSAIQVEASGMHWGKSQCCQPGTENIPRWLIGKPVDVRREKSAEQKTLQAL
jgi:hypothetical protein